MALINEITKGAVASLNGMIMYRKFDANKAFTMNFQFVDENNLSDESYIQVNYLQYYKNSNGDTIDHLTEYMHYIIPNIPTYKKAQSWFETFARLPIVTTYGIMDAIEYTLNALPVDIPNGYVLQNPNPPA